MPIYTPDSPDWCGHEASEQILFDDQDPPKVIALTWVRTCLARMRELRKRMNDGWIGLTDENVAPLLPHQNASLLDWLLAGAIARENVLLLGEPGVGKSEIAVRFFKLLGLQPPVFDDEEDKPEHERFDYGKPETDVRIARRQAQLRKKHERNRQKYFHYQLGRYTQPEELFGPIDIGLLRQGILFRVNYGLLTGSGVRAAFLDEIFKAASSILNTLLTLTQERTFFNWGAMEPSDLQILIGASNEMPGGFGSGVSGIGAGGEDFQNLHAFIDRFPIRMHIPLAGGTTEGDALGSDLVKATDLAIEREARRFIAGTGFDLRREKMPCLNDLLLLGRASLQQSAPGYLGLRNVPRLFDGDKLKTFKNRFMTIARSLQSRKRETGEVSWSISPRKLKALYKIALAHALVTSPHTEGIEPGDAQLWVFSLIWDTPTAKALLKDATRAEINDTQHIV